LADLCHIRAIVCVPDYELGGHQVRVFPRYYKREREASEVGVRLARRTSRAAERGEVGTNGRRCRLQGVGCRVDAVASAGVGHCSMPVSVLVSVYVHVVLVSSSYRS
jgi:hypothetical protein